MASIVQTRQLFAADRRRKEPGVGFCIRFALAINHGELTKKPAPEWGAQKETGKKNN